MWWLKNKDRDRLQAFYVSSHWRKARLHVLAETPLCPDCLPSPVPATQVHHVHPISTIEGWQLRLSLYDYEGNPNLIGYCESHHSRITQMEQKAKAGETVVSAYDRMNDLNNF